MNEQQQAKSTTNTFYPVIFFYSKKGTKVKQDECMISICTCLYIRTLTELYKKISKINSKKYGKSAILLKLIV